MNNKKTKISHAFQKRLLVLVIIAFLATTAFLWIIQTRLSENNAISLLELNISDVRQDIIDASDANLLKLTWQLAEDLNAAEKIDSQLLSALREKYDVTEIDCIGEDGLIFASTHQELVGYDMASGEQSEEFMVLLSGVDEYVQSYQPMSFDNSVYRKYGGVVLEAEGFVQIGYGAERFRQDIDEFVVGVTRNRHVGENGCIIIVDENWNIVSDSHGNEGKTLDSTGIRIDTAVVAPGEPFSATVYGENCYCMYHITEGYHIVAAIPHSEAALSRNVAVGVTTAMQLLVFVALFALVYVLVKRLVVDNIYRINGSLSAITEGKLDTVVDVRSHVEFEELSNDINSTVDTLKRYIADAAARIDAELAFAKAIQHSALPSVFPPFPNRSEFEIWASMHTAREVGGDFYDFYFVDDDTLAFLVADVSGKGIPAAMFMMQSKTLLKSYAETGMSVEAVFGDANKKLCEGNDAGMFVTAWMACLNVRTGLLSFANAGHNPPLLRRRDGSIEYLKTKPGLVLAGMEGIRYRKNELRLEPGDMLYLYTDGVTEATDARSRLYGEERLLSALRANGASDVAAVCRAVKADVDAFVGEAEQFDDITMLCLEYKGPQGSGGIDMKELTIAAQVENIAAVTDFVNERLEAMDCSVKARMQIDVAIDEIFSNIAYYAYAPGVGEATVRVMYEAEPRAAHISFIDRGRPYDPLSAAEPDISLSAEERDIGGLGIYMVKKSMDEVSYSYENGCNILSIKKYI